VADRSGAALVVSRAGLQPEHGHAPLAVGRELHATRMWCAEALLSSRAHAVRRLLSQARTGAMPVGLPVPRWLSDTQDAGVTGMAAELPGGPHRSCVNHGMRAVATPMLAAERHAQVTMRRTGRGGRPSAREGGPPRRPSAAAASAVAPVATPPVTPSPAPQWARAIPAVPARPAAAGEVVRESWSAVRGLRHDEPGGPLPPPGGRRAAA
jgi:hypothetical protein